ncbi:Plant UBX domain-containing protein 10 [Linum perenne]
MVDVDDKLAYFQSITGLEDLDLCTDILQAHGWDLELAISSFTGGNNSASSTPSADTGTSLAGPSNSASPPSFQRSDSAIVPAAGPGLAWKLVTLPVAVISGSLGLVSGAVGLGLWVAGGVLSHSFGMIGLGPSNGESSSRLVSASPSASEAMDFVAAFEREYGTRRPNFVTVGFMDALQRSRDSYKLLFVYLHSPDHSDSPVFCEETLCSEVLTDFVNHNFVSWGGSIRASEGFKMSSSLKASRYPFCAVVMPATNQRIALLQQIEGPQSPEEMLTLLQRVLEESAPVLTAARIEAEERMNNMRLREEQDAAYREALEADQARERQRREEQERLEQEAAETERKRKEEEEARERAAEEGERKERRFHSSTTIQSLYDFVDSLGYIEVEDYSLVSNFPRTVYGDEKRSLSLKEAGLHPQASLFVELN